jgi:hypothetical protein
MWRASQSAIGFVRQQIAGAVLRSGCSEHPVFPAPSDFKGDNVDANLGRNASRDREVIFSS